jgi:GntR family transcriptional repressor for pyruvate dehydrogenase complex
VTGAADEPNALGGRPLRRTLKRSEQIARDILRLTRVRALAPGSSLPTEASMIAQYGISRGTLREALRILEVYGLITIKPGRAGGPRLAEIDASDFGRSATFYYASSGATLRDLADSRLIVEPVTARLAAERRTSEDIRLLHQVLDAGKEAVHADELVNLSLDFHGMVGKMSGNPVLALIDASFEEIFSTYWLDPLSMPENQAVLRVHEKIALAIVAGDAETAERAMRRHLEEFVVDFTKHNPGQMDRVIDWV